VAYRIIERVLLVVVALCFGGAARGASLAVADSPDWRPASDAQRNALAAATPGCVVVDFSLCDGGGAGSILQSPVKTGPNKQVLEGSVAGYISEVRKGGQTIVSRSPAAVGKLPGVCVTSKGEAKGRTFGVVTYLVFSKRDMYSVSVYGPAGLAEADPLVERYLRRIQIGPDVVAGDIASDSAYEQGRKIGTLATRVLFVIGVGVIVVMTVAAMLKRRRAGKPPPLPGRG
jgi:hypothetical protein